MQLRKPSSAEQLYDLLASGHRLTKNEARQRLGLKSKRQIRRLVNRLKDRDIPVQETFEDGRKMFFLEARDQRPEDLPVDLTERQVRALLVAAEAAQATLRPTPLAEALQAATKQLRPLLDQTYFFSFEPGREPERWHFEAPTSMPIDAEVFETLHRAIASCQSVRIDYHAASSGNRSTDRKIDPLVIAVRKNAWMVAAYCHRRKQVRDFNLFGIQSIRLCDSDEELTVQKRHADFDPDTYYRGRFSALAGDQVHTVRLLAEPKAARYFRRKRYHPTQQVAEEREDGRIVIEYEVAGLEEIASFVRSWGPKVKVLAPDALAERVAEEARQTAARYAPGAGP